MLSLPLTLQHIQQANISAMKRQTTFIIFIILCCLPTSIFAQQAVVKTNLLYWTTGTPNLSIELATGRKHSISVAGGFMPWQYSDTKKLKHWLVQPEFRYWPCETFNGHFWGVHALGGQFNAGGVNLPFGLFLQMKESRYQGWTAGAGLSYGYHWMLNRKWSLEFSLGLGYLYIDYKKYKCTQCGKAQKENHRNYVGPTKAAINLIYIL